MINKDEKEVKKRDNNNINNDDSNKNKEVSTGNDGNKKYILNNINNTENKEKISDKGDKGDTGDKGDKGDKGSKNNNSKKGPLSPLSKYHLYHKYIDEFPELFSTTLKGDIEKAILKGENTPISLDKIAEKVGSSKGSVSACVNRYKDIFVNINPNGTKSLIKVIKVEVERVSNKIQEKLARREAIRTKSAQEMEVYKNVKNFIKTYGPERNGNVIYLDFKELQEYDPRLADSFTKNPEEIIKHIFYYYTNELKVNIDIEYKNLPTSMNTSIQDIRVENVGSLMVLEGRVASRGSVNAVTTSIKFECPSCGTIMNIPQNYRRGVMDFPKSCSCGRRGGFQIVSMREENVCFIQLEDLQEKTDNPYSSRIKGVLFNRLANSENIENVSPGNEVKVVGVLKKMPKFKGGKELLFSDYLFEIKDVETIDKDIKIEDLTEEEINTCKEISSKVHNEGLDSLVPSFAPDVEGLNSIKKAIMMQLANKRNNKKVSAERNKSNILLVGDPGSAKSVLADFAINVSTGARKAIGGSSSGVGITASVVKDEDDLGGYRVEPGAMVLAKDIFVLDELNNLSDEDKPKTQEGLESQQITINKATIHARMSITCGTLGICNPRYGHFKDSEDETIQSQFNIPTPILNRFDTVFVVRDIKDYNNDIRIAKRMIKRKRNKLNPEYSQEQLKNYFAYVRQREEPEMDDEMEDFFATLYAKARNSSGEGVKINPRFVASLNRMSNACAKMRGSNKIEKQDIKMAYEALSDSEYKVGTFVLDEIIKMNGRDAEKNKENRSENENENHSDSFSEQEQKPGKTSEKNIKYKIVKDISQLSLPEEIKNQLDSGELTYVPEHKDVFNYLENDGYIIQLGEFENNEGQSPEKDSQQDKEQDDIDFSELNLDEDSEDE